MNYQNHLELKLITNPLGQTVVQHQYTAYPLRLSSVFRLEKANCDRAYLYLINTSPGLLAGDELNLLLHLDSNTQIYFTDQAATKVHSMPKSGTKAVVNYQIIVESDASLEFVPEPIILYQDASIEQTTIVQLHPTARLFLSEIILPGRLARSEYYQFNYYFNRLKVTDLDNNLLFADAARLLGQSNKFKHNELFTELPIIGNAIAILPDVDLSLLIAKLETNDTSQTFNIELATTILPNCNSILIRALSNKTASLKDYFTYALNSIRSLTAQSSLPYIAK
ncbi:MAG: urease accessory protein UreD [Cyanobacteria bacterium J06621_8]